MVALDGPASSGKSSVGAAAAERLGLRFLDTGLLYRALTALALREQVPADDAARLVGLVDRIELADDGTGRLTRVLIDGEDATSEARGPEVDAAVSAVSRVAELRAALLERQRAMAAAGGIVVAGRDIGTVVLPDATVKLFLDATVDERANRRIEERGLDPDGEEAATVREQLRARDLQDRTRAVAPLRAADDAVVITTDGNAFEHTVDLVVAAIEAAGAGTATAKARDVPLSEPSTAEAPNLPTPEPPTLDPPPAEVPMPEPAPAAEPSRSRSTGLLEIAMRLDNEQTTLIRYIALLSRVGARLFANVEITGLERIPHTGPVILALNHASNADAFFTGSWITPALRTRRIHWLGKRELFAWPIFGWLAAHGGIHPVERATADVEAYRLATRILERGYVLLIFPEGTRSPTGALQEARDGMAALALRTGATIVPIGINDSDRVWPKGRKVPLPIPRRTVRVRVGEPFQPADLVPPGTDRRAAKSIATRGIMARIAVLLEPRQRGFYADAAAELIADTVTPESPSGA